ncbi:MAG: trypsin-like peptidase domain-containing protein [Myxococcales bacterium]|nr:trypsin-like peptidase domain-containing protein [Myxococcales bacterium]
MRTRRWHAFLGTGPVVVRCGLFLTAFIALWVSAGCKRQAAVRPAVPSPAEGSARPAAPPAERPTQLPPSSASTASPLAGAAIPPPASIRDGAAASPLTIGGPATQGDVVDAAALPGTLTAAQQSRRTPVVDAVHRAAPSVVSILTEQRPQYNPFGFFGLEEDSEDNGRTSLGSGVIVEAHGLVITNEHVVAGAARIRVQLADGRELPATLIGADQSFDLAVLKVETQGRELPALRLGTAADLMIGETVIAIGNPFGLSHTVTSGVISALHRVVRAKSRTYEDFIQTDAQINPGNSGGPLLNIHGELVGINTAVHSGGPGIGFAIPIDRARTIVNDLLQFGRVRYGWLGIRPGALRQGRRAVGVVVAEVESGSPAERAGLQRGDVISGINEDNTHSVEAFWDRVGRILAGEEVRLRLQRGDLRLQAAPLDPKEQSVRAQRRLGLDVTDAEGRAVLVRRVLPGGIADRIGFQPGDAILQIGARTIKNARDFAAALGEIRPGNDTVMLVVRGQYSYYVTVPL